MGVKPRCKSLHYVMKLYSVKNTVLCPIKANSNTIELTMHDFGIVSRLYLC